MFIYSLLCIYIDPRSVPWFGWPDLQVCTLWPWQSQLTDLSEYQA